MYVLQQHINGGKEGINLTSLNLLRKIISHQEEKDALIARYLFFFLTFFGFKMFLIIKYIKACNCTYL